MDDGQVIEWDKDDIDALKFMKVDVLGLGMLGCMRRAFALLDQAKGKQLDLATIPAEDPATYAIIRKADTMGTFQIELRAQMSMLPRLKPKTFYDLVIEVAIVRAGPIQGDMVHPYIRRREGKEKVSFRHLLLRRCSARHLACRSSRNRPCRWRWSRRDLRRLKPISFAARWRPSALPKRGGWSLRNSHGIQRLEA